nr:hypothetical protein [Tanacetum cinerariifolium]
SAEISDLNASLHEKVLVITALKESLSKVKGKDVVNEAVPLHSIDPRVLKIDVAPLAPKLHKNRTILTDYIRHTQEEAATLREIIERVNLLYSASGSKSLDNTKNDRIQQTLRKAKKNKLKEHLRTVRPNLNKKSVIDTTTTSSVTNSMSNVNSNLKCASDHPRKVKSSLDKASVVDSRASSSVIKSVSNVNPNLKCANFNGCLFADNHDKCVVEYINSVNARRKSKSAKKPVNRKVWKTTGKVFKTVGYKWTPTGRTFTLVGNVCPLTWIATDPIVPPRETIPTVQSSNKPVVTLVYTRKPSAKNVPNKMEPNKSWGSSSNVS